MKKISQISHTKTLHALLKGGSSHWTHHASRGQEVPHCKRWGTPMVGAVNSVIKADS